MRRTNPQLHRPFRTPWVPFTPIAGILVNLAMMFALGWENWLRLGVWLGIGLVIYFAYSQRHSHIARSLEREIRRGGVSPGGRPLGG
jgi:APA family basic amino acid/polyamine antiporter